MSNNKFGCVAQLVEHRIPDPKVVSSNLATFNFLVRDSIVASIPACHAGDRGSIPRRGVFLMLVSSFRFLSLLFSFVLYLDTILYVTIHRPNPMSR